MLIVTIKIFKWKYNKNYITNNYHYLHQMLRKDNNFKKNNNDNDNNNNNNFFIHPKELEHHYLNNINII